MPKIFYRNILSMQQRRSYKQEVRKLVNWFRHLALLHVRRKEIWRDTRAFPSQMSRVTNIRCESLGVCSCSYVKVCERQTQLQSLIFIRLLPWKRHVSDAYRLLAMCSELCWRTPIWQNQTVKPVTREAIHIIAQQWQQSVDSKQCLIVAGEHLWNL